MTTTSESKNLPRLMPSIRFRETLAGGFVLDSDEGAHLRRPMSVSLTGRAESLWRLARDRTIAVTGELDAIGLADRSPLAGTVELAGGYARYALEFDSNEGVGFLFQGRQRLSLWGFPAPVTILEARLKTPAGGSLGRALLRFDLRSDLWTMLRSFRIHHRGRHHGS